MQRSFAGVFGATAFTICVFRGWALGGDAARVLPQAALFLTLFAVVGAAAGRVALWTVEEGVAARFREQLEAQKSKTTARRS